METTVNELVQMFMKIRRQMRVLPHRSLLIVLIKGKLCLRDQLQWCRTDTLSEVALGPLSPDILNTRSGRASIEGGVVLQNFSDNDQLTCLLIIDWLYM